MKVLSSENFNKIYQKDLTTIVLINALYNVSKQEIGDRTGIIDIEFEFPEGYEEMIDQQIEIICSK